MLQPRLDLRRARLFVPAAELREIERSPLLHRADEILAGRRFAVMPLEIQVAPCTETFGPRHGRHHADHLRALVIDGGGVEVADLHIAVGADRVRERPCILGKLRRAQHPHVLDPLDRFGPHVGGKTLVAIDGETLFQAQLEPVAAGHAVARPVVEIFVRDHALDRVIIVIGRGIRIGEDIARIEDVEALVLHRPHVEIADRDDVEHRQIVFEAVDALVPGHRGLERLHRMRGAPLVACAHEDGEIDMSPALRREAVARRDEIARDQREQIARLGVRIAPAGIMPPAVEIARFDQRPVGEQHRKPAFVRAQQHLVDRHIVGPVDERDDAAKAFGLALGTQHAVRGEQAHQLGVGIGRDAGAEVDDRAFTLDVEGDSTALLPPIDRLAIDGERLRQRAVAIEPHRAVVIAVADNAERGVHLGRRQVEIEFKADRLHPPVGRLIIRSVDHRGFVDCRAGGCGLDIGHGASLVRG